MMQVKSEPGGGRNRDPGRSRWTPQANPSGIKQEPRDGSDHRGIKRERSRSPAKRNLENDEKTHQYWSKQDEEADKPSQDDLKVVLDSYNSDLSLQLDPSGYQATPITREGFAFVWSGARASFGVKHGKACFEVKVTEQLDVSHLPDDEINPHVVRVGFSCEHTSMQLGEEPLSYGYGGTGKASVDCKFRDYGVPFAVGDVVTAFVDMDRKPVEISFAVNGRHLGVAFRVNANELRNMALFPHILTKNCSFQINFGQEENPFFPLPAGYKDYRFFHSIKLDDLQRGTQPPMKKSECEMLMMCGLPGCGKTTWAEDFCKKHPEKKYNVLGTNSIIDKMKVMGLPRKRNYHGRWEVLIQMSTKCLNTLFSIGSKKLRNYILDQTNVYPSAQRRKMSSFAGFRRLAVVVVPTHEEFVRRCDKRDREEGKEIPDHAILEMKANFGLPNVGDLFDEVIFTECPREEADKLVKQYNEEGQAVFPANKKFRSDNSRGRGQGFSPRGGRGDFRGNSRSDSSDRRDSQGWRGDGFGSRGGERGGRFPGGGRDWSQQRDSPSLRDDDRDRGGWGGPRRDGDGGGDWRNSGGRGEWSQSAGGRDSSNGSFDGGFRGSPGYERGRGFDRGGRGGGRGRGDRGRGDWSGRGGGRDSDFGGRGGGRDSDFGGRGGRDSDFGGRDSEFGGRGGRDSDFGGRGGRDSDFGGRGGRDSNFGGRGGRDNEFGGRGGRDSEFGGRGGRDRDWGGRGGGRDSDVGGRGGRDNDYGGGGGRDSRDRSGDMGGRGDWSGRGDRDGNRGGRDDRDSLSRGGGYQQDGSSYSYNQGSRSPSYDQQRQSRSYDQQGQSRSSDPPGQTRSYDQSQSYGQQSQYRSYDQGSQSQTYGQQSRSYDQQGQSASYQSQGQSYQQSARSSQSDQPQDTSQQRQQWGQQSYSYDSNNTSSSTTTPTTAATTGSTQSYSYGQSYNSQPSYGSYNQSSYGQQTQQQAQPTQQAYGQSQYGQAQQQYSSQYGQTATAQPTAAGTQQAQSWGGVQSYQSQAATPQQTSYQQQTAYSVGGQYSYGQQQQQQQQQQQGYYNK